MKMCAGSARVINCVALIVYLLVCGIGLTPTFAREHISAGQAGDPTDGNGIASTNGSSYEPPSETSRLEPVRPISNRWIPELVFVLHGVVYRVDVQLLLNSWKRT